MIQQNLSKAVRKQLARQRARTGKENTQHAFNHLLWQIIAQKEGGKLTVPCSDLRKIPPEAALKAEFDAATDSLTITAALVQGKTIISNTGIITG